MEKTLTNPYKPSHDNIERERELLLILKTKTTSLKIYEIEVAAFLAQEYVLKDCTKMFYSDKLRHIMQICAYLLLHPALTMSDR